MTTAVTEDVGAAMRDALAAAGATANVHARELETDAGVGLDADATVVLASVFKIPVLLEVCRQAAAGERALTDRIRVPVEGRAPGPTGLSAMRDPVELSLRDLALMMMSVSDNAATDELIRLVGLDSINTTLRDLGLDRTRLMGDCGTLLEGLALDAGFESIEELESFDVATAEPDRLADLAERLRDADAVTGKDTNSSTPRETTRLLQMIWRDEAGPAVACAETRRILGLQVFRDRLASGFPDGVTVSGKTGTLPFLRNEAGVVEYPDGGRYAVAVFTRAETPELRQPDLDRVIGTVARIAVDHLRGED